MLKKFLGKLSSILKPKSEEQMLKNLYTDSELPKEVLTMLERQSLKFDVAHVMLLERFEIHVPSSKSFNKVCAYLRHELPVDERMKLDALMKGDHGRRKAFMFMVELREITPSMLNNCFPLGEKRNQFEQWLDGKINQLP